MQGSVRAASLLLGAALLGACGATPFPEEHFYRLHVPDEVAPQEGSGQGRLLVAPIEVAPFLAGDRIQAAVGPVRLEGYARHRWVAPLDRLLTDAALRYLDATARFAVVVPSGPRARGDLVLVGEVWEFFEVDKGDGWLGRVAMGARLLDAETGEEVWRGTLREEEPATRRHPEAVVQALSTGWARILDRVSLAAVAAMENRRKNPRRRRSQGKGTRRPGARRC